MCGSTKHRLHIWDISQVAQQLMQQVIWVGRNGLQMFQKQLHTSNFDQSCAKRPKYFLSSYTVIKKNVISKVKDILMLCLQNDIWENICSKQHARHHHCSCVNECGEKLMAKGYRWPKLLNFIAQSLFKRKFCGGQKRK